ncbi:MAG: glycosyltransferase [Myxococcales bacterium]|nr:MAG: glycosyltransferase [Myxococcales bacterium]
MDSRLKQAEDLFAAGQIDEAKTRLVELLSERPDDAEVLNDLGVVAWRQGNANEAWEFLSKALARDPAHRDAVLNLVDVAKAQRRMPEALSAVEAYLERCPEDAEIAETVEALRREAVPKAKLAFVAAPGYESFLPAIVAHLAKRYEVRTCYTMQKLEIAEAAKWADLVWLEWANELAVGVTNEPGLLDRPHVVCRLHSYEAFAPFVGQIAWRRIDDLIFVAPHIRDIALAAHPAIGSAGTAIHVIPNGVDLEKFPFVERPRGKRLAFLGSINYKKGPMLLLHAFKALADADGDYTLHVAGSFQDGRYSLYFEQMIAALGLKGRVYFDGQIGDVPAWLADKHAIVCTSVLEGHPVGLLEAMACGLKPLIHNFVGARGLYPAEFVWNSIPEFVRMATRGDYAPKRYREYVERYGSLDRQLVRIEQVIERAILPSPDAVWTEAQKVRPDEAEPPPERPAPKRTEAESPSRAAPETRPAPAPLGQHWAFPPEAFDPDPAVRLRALADATNKQINAGRFDLVEASLDRVLRLSGYAIDNVLQQRVKLCQTKNDIPGIQALFKRAAFAAALRGADDAFFNYLYAMIYAEQLFARTPAYRFAVVDEDVNVFVRLAARQHPLAEFVRTRRVAPWKDGAGRPFRVGFLMEGLSLRQAASRLFFPLVEHDPGPETARFVYSRFSLAEEIAKREDYAATAQRFAAAGATVRCPDQPLSPARQLDFLVRAIVADGIDALVLQTAYFVPQFNFLAALRPARLQTAIDMQQPEYAADIDAVFTLGKSVFDIPSRTAPPIISLTRNADVASVRRADWGIPEDATLIVTANRAAKYVFPAFWREVEQALERHPEAWYMPLGLKEVGDLLPAGSPARARVVAPGYHADVMPFFKAADLYLNTFPLGAGSAVLEAMAAGLPVVTFASAYETPFSTQTVMIGGDFVAIPDLVVPHDDFDRWHRVLDELLSDAAFRARMKEAVLRRAEEFLPERVAPRFYDVLKEEYRKTQSGL